MVDTDPPKFAHFESITALRLIDLYKRHAEVACQIHQDSLRKFTGNHDLVVDLVPSPDDIDQLLEYDVVSVSREISSMAAMMGRGVANTDVAQSYKKAFAEEDMPVYVVSAGNNGTNTVVQAHQRIADFARNSLVVGEAQNSPGQLPFIEEHSSRINPTLASDSPFNRGIKYQYYDTSPSLEGHDDLVRGWLVSQAIEKHIVGLKEAGQEMDVSEIHEEKYNASLFYEEGEGRDSIDQQLDYYLEHPDQLHSLVLDDVRKSCNIDENGFTSDVEGTSFSAPELAGYISGALYEQAQREEKNLPILTKDEITTLIKTATIDTQIREGENEPMPSHINTEGHEFVDGAGHGVFQPEMFRALLDKSYAIIETDPNIDREALVTVMQPGKIRNRNDKPLSMDSELSKNEDMVIDRVRVDIQFAVNGKIPQAMSLMRDNQEMMYAKLQTASGYREDGGYFFSWSRLEDCFGEELRGGEDWDLNISPRWDCTIEEAEITVYGYNKDGLMDQMMEYSKELAIKMAPRPEVTPVLENLSPALDSLSVPNGSK